MEVCGTVERCGAVKVCGTVKRCGAVKVCGTVERCGALVKRRIQDHELAT